MRTTQNHSTDWVSIRAAFEAGGQSNRELSKRFGVSETAIRKRAKKERWQKPTPPANLPANQSLAVVGAEAEMAAAAAKDVVGEGADFDDLLKVGRRIVRSMMREHETIDANLGLLEELIEEATAADKDPRRRNAMLKAISYITRTQAIKNLATALKTLRDAAPGKKQQAQEAARSAGGEGTLWGDDLDFGVRPN